RPAIVTRERSPYDSSPALGSTAQIHSCAAGQLVEQCLCGFQISGLEALSEPAKERCEQRAGIPSPPPITPQARQAAGGAELERLGALCAGYCHSSRKAGFDLGD